MTLLDKLKERTSQCELCGSDSDLQALAVYPHNDENADHTILACAVCKSQIEEDQSLEINHWRCLNDSIWHEVDAVKVVSYRMLKRLNGAGETWAQDLLDMMYMDDATRSWAEKSPAESVVHKDSNGVVLSAGDSVVLIKDLDVKGSSLTAKRGTAVRNIRLDPENETYIEGKVDGQQIVILTQYVKKTN